MAKKKTHKELRIIVAVGILATILIILFVVWPKMIVDRKEPGELIQPNVLKNEKVAPEIQKIAPDFELQDFNGVFHKLSSYRGQPVILEFFATWCEQCNESLELVEKIFKEHKGRQLQIFGIHLTNTENYSRAESLAQEKDLTFNLLRDEKGEVFKLYSNSQRILPLIIFIDSTGVIRNIIYGSADETRLKEGVLKIIKD